ncbi:hypothetical protein CR205_15950 [Alteribacter lacisalsi]|uniref:Uncharacterized protein n=1 Tax=Alteribacter lacisalsi TaxID=2045244 RepID=A0A2W0H261_9BACI|nr:hypothetical protein [Alteribacter lacisalsi]PYZ95874.1 hypothetical protein CR205_15950 [Alteribacter lacisalsi]
MLPSLPGIEQSKAEWLASRAKGSLFIEITDSPASVSPLLWGNGETGVRAVPMKQPVDPVRYTHTPASAGQSQTIYLPGTDIPFPDSWFDVVILNDASNAGFALINEISRILKPKGKLLVSRKLDRESASDRMRVLSAADWLGSVFEYLDSRVLKGEYLLYAGRNSTPSPFPEEKLGELTDLLMHEHYVYPKLKEIKETVNTAQKLADRYDSLAGTVQELKQDVNRLEQENEQLHRKNQSLNEESVWAFMKRKTKKGADKEISEETDEHTDGKTPSHGISVPPLPKLPSLNRAETVYSKPLDKKKPDTVYEEAWHAFKERVAGSGKLAVVWGNELFTVSRRFSPESGLVNAAFHEGIPVLYIGPDGGGLVTDTHSDAFFQTSEHDLPAGWLDELNEPGAAEKTMYMLGRSAKAAKTIGPAEMTGFHTVFVTVAGTEESARPLVRYLEDQAMTKVYTGVTQKGSTEDRIVYAGGVENPSDTADSESRAPGFPEKIGFVMPDDPAHTDWALVENVVSAQPGIHFEALSFSTQKISVPFKSARFKVRYVSREDQALDVMKEWDGCTIPLKDEAESLSYSMLQMGRKQLLHCRFNRDGEMLEPMESLGEQWYSWQEIVRDITADGSQRKRRTPLITKERV